MFKRLCFICEIFRTMLHADEGENVPTPVVTSITAFDEIFVSPVLEQCFVARFIQSADHALIKCIF